MEEKAIRAGAEALCAKLTLEEKIGMIHGAHLFSTQGVERLGIPPLVMSDGPMGVRQEFEPDHWKPVGSTDDFVTYLPCNSALAATWNRKLAEEMGSVLGAEARGRGKDVILAPGINIKRSPLCGRNFEYFSEDPYLTGQLAAPFIQGVQRWDVAACVKHFAANNQETQRLWVDVEVDERALREIYLPAFYDCLTEGGSLSVMGAYNRLRGEHCCQSEYLLNEILRKEWGYDGVVISDWGAVHDTKLAALSQLDIEMSTTDNFDRYFMADPLKEAVMAGDVPEEIIDEKVVRILTLMMRLHMIEGDAKGDTKGDTGRRRRGVYNAPEHRQTALRVAEESIVLLKNQGHRLPLCAERMKKILLIGENAERIHSNGGGSAEIRALYEISPLMGIKMLLGGGVKVDFARGYSHGQKETEEDVCKLAASAEYDAVIYVGGLNHDYDSESSDRSDRKLPYGQDQLLCSLLAARPDLVVVLIGGSSVEMEEWIDSAQAVVWSYYAGMEGGYALARVLFGEANPSGRLPETFYRKTADCSAHCLGEFGTKEKVAYRESVFVGYRYQETFGADFRFCFGHGLSYTEFAYRDGACGEENGRRFVTCRIENTGECAGAETVQVYQICEETGISVGETVEIPGGKPMEALSGLKPKKELIGFEKLFLQPGESAEIRIALRPSVSGRIGIGSSVRDIRILL